MNRSGIIICSFLLLAGCGDNTNQPVADHVTPAQGGPTRQYDKDALMRGDRIFQTHCAACHGSSGEAQPNWQKVGPDGKYPPPPLDDSGRAWLRSRAWLKHKVINGSPAGQGNMPAWGNKLSPAEIDDVVTRITALWSDAVYLEWWRKVEQPELSANHQ